MASGSMLRYVQVVAWSGLIIMCAALGYGLSAGNFRADGAELATNPWGIVTLVDIYVGFALFSCWVVWRESRPAVAVSWVVLIMLLGNAATSLYVIVAAVASRSDARRFWMGAPSEEAEEGIG